MTSDFPDLLQLVHAGRMALGVKKGVAPGPTDVGFFRFAGGILAMQHSRQEVIRRTIREFELLDHLVADLSEEEWMQLVPRPEAKDPWTVKDAVAHITHFKADVIRSMHRIPKPTEVRGLAESAENHVVYLRWRDRSPQEVLAWHRQVQEEALVALQEAPEEWFSGRERRAEWPFDLDGHSACHQIKDIEEALQQPGK